MKFSMESIHAAVELSISQRVSLRQPLLFFLQDANEIFERRARDHSVKLGSEVGDDANIIDDDVVDFSIRVYKVELIIDEQSFGTVGNDLCIDLRAIRVVQLTGVENR